MADWRRNTRGIRGLSDLLWSLLVSLAVSVVWSVVGVMNIETGLHIIYSFGSSSGWHDWLTRGAPGEVVRHWGVPVYDQWSGLGYRLPTQGLLTDTPLSYLALFLPVNAIVFVAWCGSLWFLFHQVHRWIGQWVSRHCLVFCVFVDAVLVGVMSFYTLWHGWQTLAIQVSGAMVCFVVLTDRALLSESQDVEVFGLSSKLSCAALMLLMPHLGYGSTFVPAMVVVAAVVLVSRRAELARWCRTRPQLFVPPMLAALALLPGLLDYLRESGRQSMLDTYAPEFGVLHYLLDDFRAFEVVEDLNIQAPEGVGRGVIVLAHTFVFPVVALFDPAAFEKTMSSPGLSATWNASPWSHNRITFHGGVLAVVLAIWAWRIRGHSAAVRVGKTLATVALASMLVALLNTRHPSLSFLSLDWVPTILLSNGRWQYADLSLLLTLVLLVLMGGRIRIVFSKRARPRALGVWVTRGMLMFGLVVAAGLLAYRLLEPVRLGGGQTRFAPLQLDSTTRRDNEEWRERIRELQFDLNGTSVPDPQRVLTGGPEWIGGEGDNVWWGLRTHSQLRDIQLSSLSSWPRTRSGETLVPGSQLQHVVTDPVCHEGLARTVDVLSVSWSVLATPCVEQRFPNLERIKLAMPPQWSSITSNRPRQSIMSEMVAYSSAVDYSAFKTEVYHHWWTPADQSETRVCSFLVEDCVTRLRLIEGRALDSPPLEICKGRCVATYRLTEPPPPGSLLVIPLNYDDVLRTEVDGRRLSIRNYAGLLAIDTDGINQGTITVSVQPDTVMALRALAPLACLWLILGVTLRTIDRYRYRSGAVKERPTPLATKLTKLSK
jgi:hypothetical protein